MSNTKYVVDIDLRVSGDPAAAALGGLGDKTKKLEDDAKSAGDAFSGIGGRFVSGFTGAVETAGKILMGFAAGGFTAAMGAVHQGVMGVNKELETTQISLAAVLNAQGQASSLPDAMEQASNWVRQMKIDARDLPGEFSDLLYIVQTAAGSAFNIGLDPQNFEKLAAQAMAASKALAVHSDMAGRELAHLLEGRAGAQNVFGTRLGLTAENFNSLAPEERLKKLTEAFGKFEPAIKMFGSTYDAQSSTLVDFGKSFTGAATAPLFKDIVQTITEINEWFAANETTVQQYARQTGRALHEAFITGKEALMEYGPVVADFLVKGSERLLAIWKEIAPHLRRAADAAKGVLSDPQTLDRIERILKLYVGVKVTQVAGGGLMSLGAMKGGPMGGWLTGSGGLPTRDGLLAGGKQLLGGVGNLAAGTAMGAAIMGEGEVALFAAAVAAATGALGPFGVALVAATVVYTEVSESNKRLANMYVDVSENILGSVAEMDRVDAIVAGTGDTFGMINLAGDNYQRALNNMATNVDEFAAEVLSHAAVMRNASIEMRQRFAKDAEQEQLGYGADLMRNISSAFIDDEWRKAHGEKTRGERLEAEKNAKKKVEGNGGMTVHNVWITVGSNQAPGQIAREVVNELGRRNRYRTTPRNTLDAAWARICEHVPGTEQLKDNIELRGLSTLPVIGSVVAARFRGKGQVPVQPNSDAWVVWQQCVGAMGLISFFDRDQLVIATSTGYYTEADPPRIVWGKNLRDFSEARNNDFALRGWGSRRLTRSRGARWRRSTTRSRARRRRRKRRRRRRRSLRRRGPRMR